MAAIIEFPKEVAVWRQHNPRSAAPSGKGAKIIIFSGIRYSREQARAKSARSKVRAAEEAEA